ncbi:type II secretion system F family protein [Cellulomonas soli]|uniref:type II secretion system F family protein n=1 Tax=Cellulomonas soli TaxID=931535 RepID=UPI003F86CC64
MTPGALAVLLTVLGATGTAPWWWSRRSRLSVQAVTRCAARAAVTGGDRTDVARAGPRARFVRSAGPDEDVEVGPALLLELVDAALGTGAALPRALEAVAAALPGTQGEDLRRVASALALGASWPTAWTHAPDLRDVEQALAVSWSTGAAAGPTLRAAADRLRRDARSEAREAAARLGVHLVLPLGLCFLPAFMLLGLVPVVLSLAGGLLG